MCSAHAGHTQRLSLMRVSAGFDGQCAAQILLLLDRNVVRNPAQDLASIVSGKQFFEVYRYFYEDNNYIFYSNFF